MKAAVIVTIEHFNLSIIFEVSHFLIAKVSLNGLNPGFRTQKKCPIPLNRSVPSIEATNTKII